MACYEPQGIPTRPFVQRGKEVKKWTSSSCTLVERMERLVDLLERMRGVQGDELVELKERASY
jgi:hypothetical protein